MKMGISDRIPLFPFIYLETSSKVLSYPPSPCTIQITTQLLSCDESNRIGAHPPLRTKGSVFPDFWNDVTPLVQGHRFKSRHRLLSAVWRDTYSI